MRIDLHVHTTVSACSRLGLDQVLDNARSLGLDGVCITDHQSRAAAGQFRPGVQPDGLVALVGMEYTTDAGDFLLFGSLPELPDGLPAPELLARVERAGAAAVAAHPFRAGRGLDWSVAQKHPWLAVEGLNGRNAPDENMRALRWGCRFGAALTGGSDAHRPEELGRACTVLDAPVRSELELARVLRAGACRPQWVGGELLSAAL